MSKLNRYLLREKRKKLGLSQSALAKKVGVSKVAISWYESGDRTPTFDNLIKLSEALNLSLDQLAGREALVVAEEEKDYIIKLSKKDISIISEFKKYPKVYGLLYNDPVRTIKLIERKLK